MVKKETMFIVAIVALVVGFLGGVIFSATRSVPTGGVAQAPAPSGPPQSGQISAENASRILALEQAVAADPKNVEAWTQLGNLYFDSDRPEQAIRAYKKSLELAPNNPDVTTDLGVMYRRNGQPVEAIAAFEQAMKINPRHEVSRFNKGIVLMYDLNDPKAAIQAWEELLAVNPAAKAPNGEPLAEMIEQVKQQGQSGQGGQPGQQ